MEVDFIQCCGMKTRMEDVDVDGKLLKWIIEKLYEVLIRFIHLREGSSGVLL